MSRTRMIGLALAILVITIGATMATRRAQAGGGGCTLAQSDAHGTTVDMKLFCILPTVLRVHAGTTVTWTNMDETPHTVTGANMRTAHPNAGSWGSYDQISQGQTFTHTFDDAGVYPYYCIIHPGMIGAVVVGDGVPADPSPPGGPANTSANGASGTTDRGSELQTSTQSQQRAAVTRSSSIDGTFVAVLAAFGVAIGAAGAITVQRVRAARTGERPAAR